MLSKNYEAYSEVARRLGDAVVLEDEEMYSVVRIRCKDKYDGQIQRILRLDRSLVSELFGH